MVIRGREGQEWGVIFNEYRISVLQDERSLESKGGHGCITM